MSEFSWDSQAVDEREQPQPDETETKQPDEPAAAPETLALSANDFSALEERVLRAVNMVKRERLARAEVEERAAKAEAQLKEKAPLAEQLQNEVTALRAERDQVRQRVERLLTQLDALEL
jgi:FtsZ-binding cell division protein ZapB